MDQATIYRCGICLESVNEPRALPCLHSFCTGCLLGLCEAEQFRCPECRKAFSLPVGGVEDFPINFYLKLASVHRRSVTATSETCFQCSKCEQSPVKLVNTQNCEVYCAKCSPIHEHVVLLEDCSSQLRTLNCPEHCQSTLEFYCSECRVLACSACLQTQHANHHSFSIAKVSSKVKDDMRAALNDGLKDRNELLALMGVVQLREEQLRTARESATSSVSEAFSHAEKVLSLHKQCLLCDIDTSCERDLMIAENGKEKAASLLAELDRVFARTSSLLEGPSLSAVTQSSVLTDMKQAFVRCDGVRNTLQRIHSQEQDKPGFPSAHQLKAMMSSIQKRCIDAMLSPSQPFPPNCKLLQPTPMPLLPRKEYVAVLSCYSGWMTPVAVSENQLSVQLFSEEGVRGETRLEQKENTLAITFSIPSSGIYQLSVKIDGTNVEGSPATVFGQRCCTGVSYLSHTLHSISGPSQYSHMAVGGEGDIAASNVTQGTIDLFDSRGLFLKSIKSDRLSAPGGLCMDPFGSIFVVDTEKKCVRRFSRNGHYVGKVGSYGPKSGQMVHPTDIAAGHDGSVYVVDSAKDRIFVYSESGDLRKEIGGYGNGPLRFRMPTSIAFSSDNKLLVADSGNKRIQVLSAEGDFLYFFGRSSEDQDKMNSPHRLTVAKDGTVVVTEKESSTALMFSDKGEYICSQQFPQSNSASKYDFPISIVPNSRHELLVVSHGHSGIAVYA